MVSEKQRRANRANSQKSTGPKTAQGKRTVSRNAIKTGLFSEATLTAGEDPAVCEQLTAAIWDYYQPQTSMEELLVEHISACEQRLRRLYKVEAGAYAPVEVRQGPAQMMVVGPDPHSIPNDQRALAESLNPGAIDLQFAFSCRMPQFEQIVRMEAHLQKQIAKAKEELERTQYARIHNLHPHCVRHMRRLTPLEEVSSESPSPSCQQPEGRQEQDNHRPATESSPEEPESSAAAEVTNQATEPAGQDSVPPVRNGQENRPICEGSEESAAGENIHSRGQHPHSVTKARVESPTGRGRQQGPQTRTFFGNKANPPEKTRRS